MAVKTNLLAVATEAIVAAQDEELLAYVRGEVPANTWRPEKYAEAVLKALGLPTERSNDGAA